MTCPKDQPTTACPEDQPRPHPPEARAGTCPEDQPRPRTAPSRRNLSRRTACALLALAALAPASALAAPAVPRAVAKRLAAWQKAAASGLTARYRLTRRTSMLWEPLVTRGTLTFVAPDRLELRDDEATGATTRLAGGALTITANDPALPQPPPAQPTTTWLQDHLLALFAARDPDALLRDARASVPRGPGLQLELGPPRGHPAQLVVDRLRVRIDEATGAILELELVFVDGDRVTLELGEHRPTPV